MSDYLDLLNESAGREPGRAGERALLYIRGLGLPAAFSLELALEALRRVEKAAGPDPAPAEVMNQVRALLREKGLDPESPPPGGSPRSSTPPMNRRPMVAEKMELSLIHRLIRRLCSGRRPRAIA